MNRKARTLAIAAVLALVLVGSFNSVSQAGVRENLIVTNHTCQTQHVDYNGTCVGTVPSHSTRSFCIHDYSGRCFTITTNAGPTHCSGNWHNYFFSIVR